ncbi:unnamed protein product [Rhizophagus irregularis]|nr:unnamed protein product [Rhizophagus irregularis]
MSNVHILKDIKDRGHRLGSIYEQELEKKLRTAIDFNSEITDFNKKLQAENSEYSEREEEFQRSYADISHSESQRELEVKYTAEIKLLKSNIKTLKRVATLAQKASSADKVQILSLETKIHELEGKLEDIDLERTYHDLDAMGGEPAQISSSEIESFRLELEHTKEDRNSKEYTIECMEKGIEEENRSFKDQLALKKKPRGASHNEVDPLPPPMNNSLQLSPKGILPTFDPTISVGGAEAVPLLVTTPIIASSASLISPIVMYSILALLLIAVIWFKVRKCWNSWKKSNTEYPPNRNYFLSSPGISEAGLYDRRPEDQR